MEMGEGEEALPVSGCSPLAPVARDCAYSTEEGVTYVLLGGGRGGASLALLYPEAVDLVERNDSSPEELCVEEEEEEELGGRDLDMREEGATIPLAIAPAGVEDKEELRWGEELVDPARLRVRIFAIPRPNPPEADDGEGPEPAAEVEVGVRSDP